MPGDLFVLRTMGNTCTHAEAFGLRIRKVYMGVGFGSLAFAIYDLGSRWLGFRV